MMTFISRLISIIMSIITALFPFIGDNTNQNDSTERPTTEIHTPTSDLPVLEDKFFVVYTKVCDDGSPWVGFCVPGSLESHTAHEQLPELIEEMYIMFPEYSGFSWDYINSHPDKFNVNYLSEAWMITPEGETIQVVYHYIRGLNTGFSN